VNGALTIAAYALRESTRRRVFVVVLILTLAFLALYAVGTEAAFDATSDADLVVDDKVLTGSTLLGLAMFTTLFLGCVLAVFLTLGVVRGDAERGLLQPLVVRPVGRTALLLGRFLGAALVCSAYVLVLFFGSLAITRAVGGWSPDRILIPALGLVIGVCILAAVGLLGSVFLSATANGIAVFMVFGAGLVAGLLGQIGRAIESPTLVDISEVFSWVLPFEALYQSGLSALTTDATGLTEQVVRLGPFGGAVQASGGIWLWALVYMVLVGAAAVAGFARKDL
jgi:Cu-processing system permease protein